MGSFIQVAQDLEYCFVLSSRQHLHVSKPGNKRRVDYLWEVKVCALVDWRRKYLNSRLKATVGPGIEYTHSFHHRR